MFPSSLVVALTGVALGLLALAVFAWGWRHGQYRDLRAQAHVILDARELRFERPWETPEQRAERARAYGALTVAPPGEWGEGADA
jgi:cbb3-type cytochrome oxidase maturation protein